MKGSMSTDLGIITVNPEVIAKYAGSVAVECFGIVGMAAVNMKDYMVCGIAVFSGFTLGFVISLFLQIPQRKIFCIVHFAIARQLRSGPG